MAYKAHSIEEVEAALDKFGVDMDFSNAEITRSRDNTGRYDITWEDGTVLSVNLNQVTTYETEYVKTITIEKPNGDRYSATYNSNGVLQRSQKIENGISTSYVKSGDGYIKTVDDTNTYTSINSEYVGSDAAFDFRTSQSGNTPTKPADTNTEPTKQGLTIETKETDNGSVTTAKDEKGNVVYVSEETHDATGTKITYTKYENGKPVSATVTKYEDENTYVIQYKYDDNGDRVQQYSYFLDSDGKAHYYDANGNEVDVSKVKENDESALAKEAKNHKLSDGIGAKGDLKSNLSYVQNSMGEVKSATVSMPDSTKYEPSVPNEVPLVGAMYGTGSYHRSITNELFSKLSDEASAITSIAQAIYEMDQEQAKEACGLGGTFGESLNAHNIVLNSNLNSLAIEMSNESRNQYSKAIQLLNGGVEGSLNKSNVKLTIDLIKEDVNTTLDKVNTAKGTVSSFLGGMGDVLEGEIWDNVRTNLEHYENILDCDTVMGNKLSEVMDTVGGIMYDFFDNAEKQDLNIDTSGCGEFAGALAGVLSALSEIKDDEEIDTEKEGPLTEAFNTAVDTFNKAEELYNEKCPSCDETYKDEDGKEHTRVVKCNTSIESSHTRCAQLETIKKTADALSKIAKYQLDRIATFREKVEICQSILSEFVDWMYGKLANPTELLEDNSNFGNDFQLDLSAYNGLEHDQQYYMNLFKGVDSSLTEGGNTTTTAGDNNAKDDESNNDENNNKNNNNQNNNNNNNNRNTGGNNGGYNGGSNGGSNGGNTGGNPSTVTDDEEAKKKAEEEAKKKAEEEAKKKEEEEAKKKAEEEAARQKAEAEAARKAAEEAAKKGGTSGKDEGTTSSEADKKAAEEAARKAAEEAAKKDGTGSTGTGVTQTGTTGTTTGGDGVTKLGTTGTSSKGTRYSGGGVNTRPSYNEKKPKDGDEILDGPAEDTINEEPVIEEQVIEEPTIEEPTVEDYIEPPVEEEPIVEEPVEVNEVANTGEPKKGSALKTLGIAAGVGLVAGASALGAHTLMKSKEEDEDEDYDYDYEK